MDKGEGIKKYKLVVTSHGDRKYSIRNIANNIVVTMDSVQGTLDLLG